MPVDLTLLDGVAWRGAPVSGERLQALLAALAGAAGTMSADRLAAEIWGEDPPANPAKAVQVLVSRARSLGGPGLIESGPGGYRLGLRGEEVDATALRQAAAEAEGLLAADPAAAAVLAEAAVGHGPVGAGGSGPLADLRRRAAADLRRAELTLARARARSGEPAAALPVLEAAAAQSPGDEAVLADLLRAVAAARGTAEALTRYEQYRGELRDRLGADPGAELVRLHRELLAADSPIRSGLHYESTPLLGREGDVRRITGLLGSARVVSILGPGGLGKTRLAHVIGRLATAPVVNFVELAGISTGEDVVGEVGSALGVRDSVSGRSVLTPEQRADVRARIAQHLDASPSLLILDNCEHVVEAVADLVAFLAATTREARVLTTTRAPLAIAAERVYPLGQLDAADAVELFAQRAVAARPGAMLEAGAVAEIVDRLDGLPLAIELAAAKVRVMAVEEIARRLGDRFALLRGGDRSAPDRHQTLLAVIDWSWNLLAEREQVALRRLSVFHDGVSLEAAEAMLGTGALGAVQSLVDQSLLSVAESGGGIRYRMLETVREFGRMRLADAQDGGAALDAQRSWAIGYAARHGQVLRGAGQIAAVDAIRWEENNLAEVLRRALSSRDQVAVVSLLAALAGFWMVLGEHTRVFTLTDAVAEALEGWSPEPAEADAARMAVALTLNNSMITGSERIDDLRALLRAWESEEGDPEVAAYVRVVAHVDPRDFAGFTARLESLAADADRPTAVNALIWLAYARENLGDPEGARAAAEHALGLVRESDGPWQEAILHTQAAALAMQSGDVAQARAHAARALPVLVRLGARDDALQLNSLLALGAISEGDLADAEELLERLEADRSETLFGGPQAIELGRAELALARGEDAAGLALYRAAAERAREVRFPGVPVTGLEPWMLFAEAAALNAHATAGADADALRFGAELFATVVERLGLILDPGFEHLDYPVCGLALFALGSWALRRGGLDSSEAIRLLVLARRFSYNRSAPSFAWEPVAALAERASPGTLADLEAGYGDAHGPDLLAEARTAVGSLEVPLVVAHRERREDGDHHQ